VLGTGKLSKALTIKAGAFSETAKAAIEAAGGTAEKVTAKKKWTRNAYKKAVAAAGGLEAYTKQKLARTVGLVFAQGQILGARGRSW
jgi:large subunit ribosomal protein L15